MNAEKLSLEDMVQSLTGYEARSIRKNFESDWNTLAENSPTDLVYALVFVHKKREGLDEIQALDASLSMSLAQVQDFFVTEEEDVMPDEPDTESGKEG